MRHPISIALSRYGIARNTYSIRTRPHKERLPFDPYTTEVMLSNRVDCGRVARCLRGSGFMVRTMSSVSLFVAS